jgi:shikimate dehydrogenase
MMSRSIGGATRLAGVVGAPVRHSLSPLIHNAWLESAGLDAAYVAFSPAAGRFSQLVEGFRGGAVAGLNVTLPFKEEALALADQASGAARAAGAANLLIFRADGRIDADNTDGIGLLAAFAEQARGFDVSAAPATILGAGGATRGAVAALIAAGAPSVRLVNRTRAKAEAIAAALVGKIEVFGWDEFGAALSGAGCLINATSLGLNGEAPLTPPLDTLPQGAVVMDMVYRPLKTAFLAAAEASGQRTVDGLAMLIGQARPSFEAFFGLAPPADTPVRQLVLAALGETRGEVAGEAG